MRFDGVVSYGDDPWASDVWHVLLKVAYVKWRGRRDPGLGPFGAGHPYI
jgi:hypothetical protein